VHTANIYLYFILNLKLENHMSIVRWVQALGLASVLMACGGGEDNPHLVKSRTDEVNLTHGESSLRPPSEELKAAVLANAGQFADVMAADEFVTKIEVCWSSYIDSITLTTNKRVLPKHGGDGGYCQNFNLQAGEHILRIWGERNQALETLSITTTQGRTFGVYGTSHTQSRYSQSITGGTEGTFNGFSGAKGSVNGSEALVSLNIISADTGADGGLPFADRLPTDETVIAIQTCWDSEAYVRSVQLRTNKGWRPRQGAEGGQCATATLEVNEFVSDLVTPSTTVLASDGTSHNYIHAVSYFTSNGRILGPYGRGGGVVTAPHIPQIYGFTGWYGSYGQWLEGIELMTPKAGGDGANIFEDILPNGHFVKEIRICAGPNALENPDFKDKTLIRSIQAIDAVSTGTGLTLHGASKTLPSKPAPVCNTATMQPGEHIIEITGSSITDIQGVPIAVESLRFRSNLGNTFGPYGGQTGAASFILRNPSPRFLGFSGHATQAGNTDGGTLVGINFSVPSGYPIVAPPDASAAALGAWDKMLDWPLLGIHAAMLSDGRVMTYGTNGSGVQGAQFIYDVWNPQLGTATDSHLILPNLLATDMFCSGQTLLSNGQLLLGGGDARDSGYDRGIRASALFNPTQNILNAGSLLTYARWYGGQVVLNTGDVLLLGGIDNNGGAVQIPDLYNAQTKQWTPLTGAATDFYLGSYPRAVVTKSIYTANGRAAWVLAPMNNHIYRLEIDANQGTGEMIDSGVRANDMPQGVEILSEEDPDPRAYSWSRPVVQISANQLLVLLNSGKTKLVTLPSTGRATDKPTVVDAGQMSQPRAWSEMVVLPTGDVLALNGSKRPNLYDQVAYHAELWSRTSRTWRTVASQIRPRLYHSSALLLSDGSVLSVGGGAPGPQNEMSAQIYRPPYLFNAAASAARPTFSIVGSSTAFSYGQRVNLDTAIANVSKVTMVKLGSTTHSYNTEQRYIEVPFSVNRTTPNRISIKLTAASHVASPGYYFLTVVNTAGVPSESKIIRIDYTGNLPG
jgi:hypothetical protein